MAKHNELGKMGEDAAALHLQRLGYAILHRNWREERYEVDIIAENEEFIVFVEVKTRTSDEWGDPHESVGNARIKRLVQAADLYLRETDADKPVRFDIIAAVWQGKGGFRIEHFDDAFLPPVNV